MRAVRAREVRVRVASPMGPDFEASPSDDEVSEPRGVQQYLTEAVKGVFQTELAKDLKWRSNEFAGRISHDDHARLRKFHTVVKQAKKSLKTKQPLRALPAPAGEPPVSLKGYLTGAIESVFSSKDVESHEPKWHSMPWDGDIAHNSHELARLRNVERVVKNTIMLAEEKPRGM